MTLQYPEQQGNTATAGRGQEEPKYFGDVRWKWTETSLVAPLTSCITDRDRLHDGPAALHRKETAKEVSDFQGHPECRNEVETGKFQEEAEACQQRASTFRQTLGIPGRAWLGSWPELGSSCSALPPGGRGPVPQPWGRASEEPSAPTDCWTLPAAQRPVTCEFQFPLGLNCLPGEVNPEWLTL